MLNKKIMSFFIIASIFSWAYPLYAEENHPSTLTLEQATQESLEKNPELKAMEEDSKAAKAQVPQARSWEDPQIGVRFYQVPFGEGLNQAMDIDYIISQKFPFPGKKKAASQIAYHNYLHHLELLGARGREILKEIKVSYYNLYSIARRLEINQKIENNLKAAIQGAQSKIAANQTLALDSIQGQAELAKLLSEKEILKQNQINLQAKLNQLLFREEKNNILIPSKIEIPHWDMSLEESIEIALLRQPKVKIAEHQIEEKKWVIKAAKRDFLPDMNAQLEYVQRPSGSPANNLGNAWTGEFMFNVPLMIKKKTKAVEQAEAELVSAHYQYSAAKNDITFRVRDTYAKIQSYQKILDLNKKTLIPQTQQALDASLAAYANGKTNFTSVLNSARAVFDAQNEYWKTFESYTSAYSELEEALGATREELAELKSPPQNSSAESHPSSQTGGKL